MDILTELEKRLLKSSVDLSINEISNSISQEPKEEVRAQKRGMLKHLLVLSDKVDKFEVEKPKPKKQE